MCGIAGVVGPGANADLVANMNGTQRHRGPDGDGLWSAPGVSLGHRRLKIIDLSEAGRQPMSTADGRYTITYNGEVYNYRELREDLSSVILGSQTDTEVVLQSYAHWGTNSLERFVGMYAFAIWDNYERRLFCARDRLGIKPLYFAVLGENLVFASEIRAILAAGIVPEVNPRALYDFLALDFYEHGDETFFRGIYKLPPGHWMMVQDGKAGAPRRYWNLASDVADLSMSRRPKEREETLLNLCTEAVDLHLRSDVPVGVALSGGLDSAVLLTFLDMVHPDPTRVTAFSFVFNEAAYSERPYIEAMAQRTRRTVQFLEMSPQRFADTAENICYSQEEPFAGAPISAYSLCFQLAREHGFIVIMDGSGIDEGLAGYDRFRPALWADLFSAGNFEDLNRELATSGIVTPTARQRVLSQMFMATHPHGDLGKGQDLTTSARPDCLHPDFLNAHHGLLPEFEHPFDDSLRNLMYRELRYTKLPRALRFRDRLSMAVGCELRPPFLDHRLLAYEFALPAEERICNGVTKAILRRAAVRLLPEMVRLAPKRSVQTPQREWFRNELQGWVREHIDTPSFWQRGWVDRKAGLAAMESFFRGEGDNSFFLWQWINLEMWAQWFIDKKTTFAYEPSFEADSAQPESPEKP